MPNIVGPETVDTPSTDGNCVYSAAPLGGVPYVSPNVVIEGQPARIYNSLNLPASVAGVKINPVNKSASSPVTANNCPFINTVLFTTGSILRIPG